MQEDISLQWIRRAHKKLKHVSYNERFWIPKIDICILSTHLLPVPSTGIRSIHNRPSTSSSMLIFSPSQRNQYTRSPLRRILRISSRLKLWLNTPAPTKNSTSYSWPQWFSTAWPPLWTISFLSNPTSRAKLISHVAWIRKPRKMIQKMPMGRQIFFVDLKRRSPLVKNYAAFKKIPVVEEPSPKINTLPLIWHTSLSRVIASVREIVLDSSQLRLKKRRSREKHKRICKQGTDYPPLTT